MTAGVRPRGRPRSEQAEQAIIDATLELLGEGGTLSGLSVEAVAARAGVGKATIYRRWPNKDALILDALAAAKVPLAEAPGHSVRDDLIFYVDRIRQRTTTREGRILSCLVGELRRHPDLYARYQAQVIKPRQDLVRRVLRRGVETGELRADLDIELALQLLQGPMLFLTMVKPPDTELPEELSARMVDGVLEGLRPR
jgi:AcrR family transcriptional regulator